MKCRDDSLLVIPFDSKNCGLCSRFGFAVLSFLDMDIVMAPAPADCSHECRREQHRLAELESSVVFKTQRAEDDLVQNETRAPEILREIAEAPRFTIDSEGHCVRAGEFMLNLEAGLLAMQNHGYSDVLIEEHKYDRRAKVMRKRLRSSRAKVWIYDSTQKDGRPGVLIYGLKG